MEQQLNRVLDRLRGLALRSDDELTDRQLLDRFTRERDEQSFARLVRRHGPMVLGVCRRVLNDPHDADDAFQATFLVLARKSGSIRWRESVGGWLHTIARRLALRARTMRERRRLLEAQRAADAGALSSAAADDGLRSVLDDELARLPEHHRTVVLLCYVEGRTQVEAARHLGWTPGQVRGYLDRARAILRQRLSRRGLEVSAGVMGAALLGLSAPTNAAAATAQMAVRFAAGETLAGLVSPQVLTIAVGGLKMLSATKLHAVAALVVTFALAGGTAPLWAPAGAQTPPAADPAASPVATPIVPPPAVVRDHEDLLLQLADDLDVAVAQTRTVAPPRPVEVYPQWRSASAAISPNGKYLANRTGNKVIVVDTATGKQVWSQDVPPQAAMSFSPDGKRLHITLSWDAPEMPLAGVAPRTITATDYVRSVQASPKSSLTPLLKHNDAQVRDMATRLLQQLEKVQADEAKTKAEPASALDLGGKLLASDPVDPVMKGVAQRLPVYLRKGKPYVLDLASSDFDAFLRIEDGAGKELARDDDSGGKLNARIVFTPTEDANYQVVVTSLDRKPGHFRLTVREQKADGTVRLWDTHSGTVLSSQGYRPLGVPLVAPPVPPVPPTAAFPTSARPSVEAQIQQLQREIDSLRKQLDSKK